MRVFLTGSDGYIGALLGPRLLEDGHEVIGLDTGYYRENRLFHLPALKVPALLNKDLRNITEADLDGFDAVVHLAELSNDPLGELNPEITYKINHLASVNLARKSKSAGVGRFIYASSCSVYGAAPEGPVTEESETNPQTVYARCKVLVERDVSALADKAFTPVFLRNATAYGPSPSMRFDVVLNNLAGWAWTKKEIRMTSDGSPWRPLVHVHDICDAILTVLKAPPALVHKEIFNVGGLEENYRIREIAEIVARAFPGCSLCLGAPSDDRRSYRVSFKKIHCRLPDFRCRWTAASGAAQLFDLFENIALTDGDFHFRAYTRLEQLKHLIATRQLDTDLFWRH